MEGGKGVEEEMEEGVVKKRAFLYNQRNLFGVRKQNQIHSTDYQSLNSIYDIKVGSNRHPLPRLFFPDSKVCITKRTDGLKSNFNNITSLCISLSTPPSSILLVLRLTFQRIRAFGKSFLVLFGIVNVRETRL